MKTMRLNQWAAGSVLAVSMVFASGVMAAEELQCAGDGTQAELNQCSQQEYEQADAALNAEWKKLLKVLDGQDAALREVRNAQRAWIRFRDAEVASHFPVDAGEDVRTMYGSMYPMSYNGVMTTLTRQRTEQLRARIEEHGAR